MKLSLSQEAGPSHQRPTFVRFQSWLTGALSYSSSSATSSASAASAANASAATNTTAAAARAAQLQQQQLQRFSGLDLVSLQLNDPTHVTTIHTLLSRYPPVIEHFLLTQIFPLVMKRQDRNLTATGYDLASRALARRRVGFSGTPSNSLPAGLGAQCHFEHGSEGGVLRTLARAETASLHCLPAGWRPLSLLATVARASGPVFHALIDTGALVTGFTNEEAANQLLNLGLPHVDGVVFLGKDSRPMVVMRHRSEITALTLARDASSADGGASAANGTAGAGAGAGSSTTPLSRADSESAAAAAAAGAAGGASKLAVPRRKRAVIPLAQCGLPAERRFTFYDQVHTVGIDISQAPNAVAAVTVGKDMVLRDYSQGAYRMRGLKSGQRIVTMLPPEVGRLVSAAVTTAKTMTATARAVAAINKTASDANAHTANADVGGLTLSTAESNDDDSGAAAVTALSPLGVIMWLLTNAARAEQRQFLRHCSLRARETSRALALRRLTISQNEPLQSLLNAPTALLAPILNDIPILDSRFESCYALATRTPHFTERLRTEMALAGALDVFVHSAGDLRVVNTFQRKVGVMMRNRQRQLTGMRFKENIDELPVFGGEKKAALQSRMSDMREPFSSPAPFSVVAQLVFVHLSPADSRGDMRRHFATESARPTQFRPLWWMDFDDLLELLQQPLTHALRNSVPKADMHYAKAAAAATAKSKPSTACDGDASTKLGTSGAAQSQAQSHSQTAEFKVPTTGPLDVSHIHFLSMGGSTGLTRADNLRPGLVARLNFELRTLPWRGLGIAFPSKSDVEISMNLSRVFERIAGDYNSAQQALNEDARVVIATATAAAAATAAATGAAVTESELSDAARSAAAAAAAAATAAAGALEQEMVTEQEVEIEVETDVAEEARSGMYQLGAGDDRSAECVWSMAHLLLPPTQTAAVLARLRAEAQARAAALGDDTGKRSGLLSWFFPSKSSSSSSSGNALAIAGGANAACSALAPSPAFAEVLSAYGRNLQTRDAARTKVVATQGPTVAPKSDWMSSDPQAMLMELFAWFPPELNDRVRAEISECLEKLRMGVFIDDKKLRYQAIVVVVVNAMNGAPITKNNILDLAKVMAAIVEVEATTGKPFDPKSPEAERVHAMTRGDGGRGGPADGGNSAAARARAAALARVRAAAKSGNGAWVRPALRGVTWTDALLSSLNSPFAPAGLALAPLGSAAAAASAHHHKKAQASVASEVEGCCDATALPPSMLVSTLFDPSATETAAAAPLQATLRAPVQVFLEWHIITSSSNTNAQVAACDKSSKKAADAGKSETAVVIAGHQQQQQHQHKRIANGAGVGVFGELACTPVTVAATAAADAARAIILAAATATATANGAAGSNCDDFALSRDVSDQIEALGVAGISAPRGTVTALLRAAGLTREAALLTAGANAGEKVTTYAEVAAALRDSDNAVWHATSPATNSTTANAPIISSYLVPVTLAEAASIRKAIHSGGLTSLLATVTQSQCSSGSEVTPALGVVVQIRVADLSNDSNGLGPVIDSWISHNSNSNRSDTSAVSAVSALAAVPRAPTASDETTAAVLLQLALNYSSHPQAIASTQAYRIMYTLLAQAGEARAIAHLGRTSAAHAAKWSQSPGSGQAQLQQLTLTQPQRVAAVRAFSRLAPRVRRGLVALALAAKAAAADAAVAAAEVAAAEAEVAQAEAAKSVAAALAMAETAARVAAGKLAVLENAHKAQLEQQQQKKAAAESANKPLFGASSSSSNSSSMERDIAKARADAAATATALASLKSSGGTHVLFSSR